MKCLTKFLLFFLALFYITNVNAAYIKNLPQTIQQPDGTIIHCFATGDEYYNWLHDKNFFTIIQDSKTGYYFYAKLENDVLISSGFKPGETNPATVGLVPGINISYKKIAEYHNQLFKNVDIPEKNKQKKLKSQNILQKGTINNLVVYIKFSDQTNLSKNQTYYTAMFNEQTNGANSMYNYYQSVSYNQLNITTHFFPENTGVIVTYTDPHPYGYYLKYNATTAPDGYQTETVRTEREHTLLKNAINHISSQVPANLDIDNDDDGLVDNICFIVKGNAAGWNTLLWPHKWQLHTQNAFINSKQVWIYNFQLETALDASGVGVLCHEMFHTLGAPDLYHYADPDPFPDPVGAWDIMNSDQNPPQHMTQYMKMKYGNWIDFIPELTQAGTYTLNLNTSSTQNCYKIKSPFSTTEYFVLEYRKKEGVDSKIPNSGLLIYRINTNISGGNRNGPPDELYVYRPGGTLTKEGVLANATFSSDAGRTEFNDNTEPNPFLSDGSISGLNISNISNIGNTITFTYNPYTIPTNDAGITKLINPVTSPQLTTNENIEVFITNFGSSSISNLEVSYSINGGTPVTEIVSTPIPATKSLKYVFNKKADLSIPGDYTIEIRTNLLNDVNPNNNKITITLSNLVPINYLGENAKINSGIYTDLGSSGSVINTANTDDSNSDPISIGFKFKYCGQEFDKFILNTNGFIKLGELPPSTAALFFAQAQAPSGTSVEGGIFNSKNEADINIISAFNHDLMGNSTGAEFRVNVSGNAPFRICTIQFKNLKEKVNTPPNQYDKMEFQIKLYETSNIIEFVYGKWIASQNSSEYRNALVGLKGLGNYDSQLLAVNKGSSVQWNDIVNVFFKNLNYVTTATFNYGNPTARPLPPQGLTYRFVPNGLVSNITVSGQGNVTTMVKGATLQMIATITPTDASIKTVTWTVANGSGSATISSTGLLTAVANGVVTVKAKATDGSNVEGTKDITISNQGTGFDDLKEAGLAVYPNPASNVIYVKKSHAAKIQIVINDLSGKKVIEQIGNDEINHINVSNLKSGIYLMQIKNLQTNEINSTKFVIK